MKFKAIIFDMDGTIIDTEHLWKKAAEEMVICRGVPLCDKVKESLKTLRGKSLPDAVKIIKEITQSIDELEDMMQEKQRIVCKLYKKHVNFMDGFIPFHEKVKKYKLKTGIATNADGVSLTLAKQLLKLDKIFGSHIYSIADVNHQAKPNPAVYLHAAHKLGFAPEECIAVEDSASGLQAAKNAGMYCIGYNSGKDKAVLQDAHFIVDHYDEIRLEELIGIM